MDVGVDFGSLGWRAAYVSGDQVIMVPVGDEESQTGMRLLCRPLSKDVLGRMFPSLKSEIGTGGKIAVNGQSRTPDELVAAELSALKARVEAFSSQRISRVVISVPARYSASHRVALRDAALQAGFADALLLNDSMAAVIGHTRESNKSANLLVYGVGYSGFEIGLVRAARGHYRALGYETGEAPCGASLDELILQAWFVALSESNVVLEPHPQQWTATEWISVRLAAQQVKEALSTDAKARFPIGIQVPGSPQRLSFSFLRSQFEAAIEPVFSSTLELAKRMLEEAELPLSNIDGVLLIGGTARIPLIAPLIENRLGKKPLVLEPTILAKGAALHAMGLETKFLPASSLGENVEGVAGTSEIPATDSAIIASIVSEEAQPPLQESGAGFRAVRSLARPVSSPAASEEHLVTGRENTLQRARDLIDQGKLSDAESFLQELIREAQKLLETIRNNPPTTFPQNAELALARAYRLLKENKHEEAVRQSHLAWQLAPNSPKIFDEMIDIHCQSAIARSGAEDYALACRWLACAHSHDQSNTKVRQSLAERHYVQAKQLAERGRRNEALAAIKQCLNWDPEHEKGAKLSATLQRRL
jgi:tetratricopeptide (TPR) repeat protein